MTPALYTWAAAWGVPPAAVADLAARMTMLDADVPAPEPGKSESHVSSRVRLEAGRLGIGMWRNNVGALQDEDGRYVRYGLANDSVRVNKVLKSGDLIGCRPTLITQAHVGHTIGQFVSRECKKSDWVWTGSEREIAQANWATLVNSKGGDARFATWEGTL